MLARYRVDNPDSLSLEDFLDTKVFVGDGGVEVTPSEAEVEGFDKYIANYKACLSVERAAVEAKK